MLVLCCLSAMLMGMTSEYDPLPWLEDLQQVRDAFSEKYANLEWAVTSMEVNLSDLFDEAGEQVRSARGPGAAKAAFDQLARALGDRHVEFRWPNVHGASTQSAAATPCVSLGYDTNKMGRSLATHLPGYEVIGTGADEFAAGTIVVGGSRIGVIRIGLFGPQGAPALCSEAMQRLGIPAIVPCDDVCSRRINEWSSNKLTRDFEYALTALQAIGATTLLVDITQNGGGSEWAEVAARIVTDLPVTSERLGFVRGAHWVKKWTDLSSNLKTSAASASPADRPKIMLLARQADAKAKVAGTSCPSEAFWRGELPTCSWLGDGGYATGLLGSATTDEIKSQPWLKLVFTPARFPYQAGAWRGPLIVLVDGDTFSAAEEFAAVLQDNRAALILGAPTGGAGCGHTDGGTPTILTHSHGVLGLPDCARLRTNGDNEVAGIQPDLLVGFRRSDGLHRQARLLAAKLPEAIRLAERLKR
jgi:hypothetical protein